MAHSELAAQGLAPVYRSMRRWPRLKIQVPVTVIVRKNNKTVFVVGRGTDVNDGGIAVFAGAELQIGEEVEISFTPPYRGEPLVARTVVRNRRGYTYGMEFLTGTTEDTARVTKIHNVLRAFGQAQ
jgi:hypothetical protein